MAKKTEPLELVEGRIYIDLNSNELLEYVGESKHMHTFKMVQYKSMMHIMKEAFEPRRFIEVKNTKKGKEDGS
jgi:hypothetical protein